MGKVTLMEHLRACAELAKTFANGLVSELATAVTEAMEEMEAAKADKPQAVSVSIPTEGWQTDDTAGDAYLRYYDIAVADVTAEDIPAVCISPASQATAAACGLCPTCETMAGVIRLRAASPPRAVIQAEYTVEKGRGE